MGRRSPVKISVAYEISIALLVCWPTVTVTGIPNEMPLGMVQFKVESSTTVTFVQAEPPTSTVELPEAMSLPTMVITAPSLGHSKVEDPELEQPVIEAIAGGV